MDPTNNTELPAAPEFKAKCGRLRRSIFHNNFYMLTTSIESGIMLPANPLCNNFCTTESADAPPSTNKQFFCKWQLYSL